MTNKLDQVIEKASKFPFVSAVATVAAPLTYTLATNTPFAAPAIAVAATSPLTMTAMGVLGAVNIFRNRSGLSKVFSAAAVGTTLLGGLAYGTLAARPGFEPLGAFVATSIALTASGAFNTIAHFARNHTLKISAKIDNREGQQASPAARAPDNTPS